MFYTCCEHCEHEYRPDEHDRPCPEGCNTQFDDDPDRSR